MADRLQKSLDVQPSVASVGNPAPADPSAARTISAVGELASSALLSKRKGALNEELQRLGTEVLAVTEGRDLTEATDSFKSLKQAKEQGVLTDSMVNIQAEKILKQKIGNNSVLGPELRQEAYRILGFDPTGSEVQALFGKSGRTSPSRPLSESQKRRQKAEGLATSLGVDPAAVEQLMAKAEINSLQLQVASTSASLGQITSNEVFNVALDGMDDFISDSMGEVIGRIEEGGVVNPELAIAQLNIARSKLWSNYKQVLAAKGISPSAQELQAQRRELDAAFEPVIAMWSEKGTAETILRRQKNSLVDAANIAGIRAFSAEAAINSAIGQVGVQEHLKLVTKLKDPKQLALLQRNNPALAAVAGSMIEVQKGMNASFSRIMGIPLPEGAPEIPGLDDQISRILAEDMTDPEMRDTRLEKIRAQGRTFKDFSDYARKGVRAKATKREVEYIKEKWAVEAEPLIARISSAMKTIDGKAIISERDQVTQTRGRKRQQVESVIQEAGFFIEVKSGKAVMGQARRTGAKVPVPQGLQDDLKRLNAMGDLVKNGWADDVGENQFGFLERTVNKIETIRADVEDQDVPDKVQNALEAWRNSPNADSFEALRAVAPDLVAEAERRAAQQGVQTNGQ
jgi:hypothetical protein